MEQNKPHLRRGLSGRLLLLTVLFVMLSEVAIYVPSIARFRQVYLQDRIAKAHLATLVLHGYVEPGLIESIEETLLANTRLRAIEIWNPPRVELMLGRIERVDASVDLRDESSSALLSIEKTFEALRYAGQRTVRVVGRAPMDPGTVVEVIIDEQYLWLEMVDYSRRILTLSIIISLLTAGLVYLSLQLLMVRSMRRITANLIAYREDPENPSNTIRPSRRGDEIGVVERELSRMQAELREALAQRGRMAALGDAVSRINHDLKSLLSTVSVASERLARVDDPIVARFGPLLARSVEKAVHLCTLTQDLARGEQAVPQRSRFEVAPLVAEVGETLRSDVGERLAWINGVAAPLMLNADHERIYRALLNLGRNACQAQSGAVTVTITARCVGTWLSLEVSDDGPGIAPHVLEHLFEPFAGSGRSGGIGLGLATARDLIRAHGGELDLERTGPSGTSFRIELPGCERTDASA